MSDAYSKVSQEQPICPCNLRRRGLKARLLGAPSGDRCRSTRVYPLRCSALCLCSSTCSVRQSIPPAGAVSVPAKKRHGPMSRNQQPENMHQDFQGNTVSPAGVRALIRRRLGSGLGPVLGSRRGAASRGSRSAARGAPVRASAGRFQVRQHEQHAVRLLQVVPRAAGRQPVPPPVLGRAGPRVGPLGAPSSTPNSPRGYRSHSSGPPAKAEGGRVGWEEGAWPPAFRSSTTLSFRGRDFRREDSGFAGVFPPGLGLGFG